MEPFKVIYGDLATAQSVSLLIAPYHPSGQLKSYKSIQKAAGNLFHQPVITHFAKNPCVEGLHQIIQANPSDHHGSFCDLLFVVDLYERPLANLVYFALKRANQHDYPSVAMPIWREELLSSSTITNLPSLVEEIKKAITKFRTNYSLNKMEIHVISDNEQALSLFKA